ncbi:MAG: polysaccharide biosynthesis C-terminal domain-containing protein [Candidatus Micrarchaeota archaeon]|nr:polysaccharide biosynthesis C-terminal domain-containing protein [Candidatus Micrarchaeota archaeon]
MEKTTSLSTISLLIFGFLVKQISIVFSKLGGLIFYLLILNLLSKKDADLFFEANSIILILAPILSFGLIYSVLRFIPIYNSKKDYKSIVHFLISSIVILTFLSLLFYGLSFFFPLSKQIELQNYSFLIWLAIFFTLFSIFFYNIVIAFKNFSQSLILDLSLQASKVISFLFFVLVFGQNFLAALFAYIFGVFIQFLGGLFFIFKTIKLELFFKHLKDFRFSFLKENILFGLTFLLNSLIEPLIAQIDILIIAALLSDQVGSVAGYAFIALIVKNIAPLILTPLYHSQQIILVEEYQKKSALFEKITSASTKWSIYFGLVLLGFFVVFGKYVLYFIANKYMEFSLLFLYFVPFVAFDLLTAPSKMALFAKGKIKILLFCSLLVLLINIVFDILLIPYMGVSGAAAASSIAMFIGSVVLLYFASREFSLVLDKKILVALASFLISIFVFNFLLGFVAKLGLEKTYYAALLLFLAAVFIFFYFVLLFLFKGINSKDFFHILNFLKEIKLNNSIVSFFEKIFSLLTKYSG